MNIAIRWCLINFIPISLVIGYFFSLNTTLETKKIAIGLTVFSLLCLASIYARNFLPSYDNFIKAISYAPFFLIPLQILIIFRFVQLANLKNLLTQHFQSENKETIIGLIQKGDTEKALNQLLEESKTNVRVYKYLSLQKNNLVNANRQHMSSIIDDESFNQVIAKVNSSLLEFLLPEK